MNPRNFRPFLTLVRHQHPVGQGGFHTARLVGSDQIQMASASNVARRPSQLSELEWVYDCGSEKLDAIKAAIDGCYDTPYPWIDIIFISHMDSDHFNGVDTLLKKVKEIGTIALPYLNHAERAYVFARHVDAGRLEEARSSIVNVLADPVTALREFGMKRILFIRKGEVPNADEVISIVGPPRPDSENSPWELVNLDGTPIKGRVLEKDQKVVVAEVSDRSIFAASTSGSQLKWIFKPYIQQADQQLIDKFLELAAKKLGEDPTTINDKLQDSGFLKNLFADDKAAKALGAAYKKTAGNRNRTTLCIYAGPKCECNSKFSQSRWAYCFDDHSYVQRCTIGWLGTGDAELESPNSIKKFLSYYDQEINRTRVLQLPHHGSKYNFNLDLLNLNPIHCVVSASPKNPRWEHPAESVKDAVINKSIGFHHVTYYRSYLEGYIIDGY